MEKPDTTEHENLMLSWQKSVCYGTFVSRSLFIGWLTIVLLTVTLVGGVIGWNSNKILTNKDGIYQVDKRMALIEAKTVELEKQFTRIEGKLDIALAAFIDEARKKR